MKLECESGHLPQPSQIDMAETSESVHVWSTNLFQGRAVGWTCAHVSIGGMGLAALMLNSSPSSLQALRVAHLSYNVHTAPPKGDACYCLILPLFPANPCQSQIWCLSRMPKPVLLARPPTAILFELRRTGNFDPAHTSIVVWRMDPFHSC